MIYVPFGKPEPCAYPGSSKNCPKSGLIIVSNSVSPMCIQHAINNLKDSIKNSKSILQQYTEQIKEYEKGLKELREFIKQHPELGLE